MREHGLILSNDDMTKLEAIHRCLTNKKDADKVM